MSTIAKALVGMLTALGTWGVTALSDGHVTGVEWFGLCVVGVAFLGVWYVPNNVQGD